jgi:effector-binding domain-containing protein
VLTIEARTSLKDLRKVVSVNRLKIAEYLSKKNVAFTDIPFVAYHNSDINNLEIEICFPINKHISGKGDIKFSIIPEGEIVFCLIQGGHLERKHLYEEMAQWFADNKLKHGSSTYEYFYPSEDTSDDKTLVKIAIGVINGPYSQKKLKWIEDFKKFR